MRHLAEGITRFQREVFPAKAGLLAQLATTHQPSTLFIGCSDARVIPELITQADPGELFVIRTAGNLVPLYTSGVDGIVASIEYAIAVLGVKDIIVCGHSACGAMTALAQGHDLTDTPAIADWLHQAAAAQDLNAPAGSRQTVAALVRENVAVQLANLATHPSVAHALAKDSVRLHGWVFDIPTGTVEELDAGPHRSLVAWPPAQSGRSKGPSLPLSALSWGDRLKGSNAMMHAQLDNTARQQLAVTAVEAKTRKDLTWQQIADAAGLSVAFVTAAILGQHALPEKSAEAVAELLGLDDDAVTLLRSIPTRGSIEGGIPTDPTIYRFYEMIQVYGTTLKALIHEQFGDGIISAINFK